MMMVNSSLFPFLAFLLSVVALKKSTTIVRFPESISSGSASSNNSGVGIENVRRGFEFGGGGGVTGHFGGTGGVISEGGVWAAASIGGSYNTTIAIDLSALVSVIEQKFHKYENRESKIIIHKIEQLFYRFSRETIEQTNIMFRKILEDIKKIIHSAFGDKGFQKIEKMLAVLLDRVSTLPSAANISTMISSMSQTIINNIQQIIDQSGNKWVEALRIFINEQVRFIMEKLNWIIEYIKGKGPESHCSTKKDIYNVIQIQNDIMRHLEQVILKMDGMISGPWGLKGIVIGIRDLFKIVESILNEVKRIEIKIPDYYVKLKKYFLKTIRSIKVVFGAVVGMNSTLINMAETNENAGRALQARLSPLHKQWKVAQP